MNLSTPVQTNITPSHQQQQQPHIQNILPNTYQQPSIVAAQHPVLPITHNSPMAFDMHIPTNTLTAGQHARNNHPQGCSCCVYHHNNKNSQKVLYRHQRDRTFIQNCKDSLYQTWELTKMTYWHIEPWVFRPLIAGIAYNLGIQLARIFIQYLFPSFFPTTVYFPLRANARFYDLHNKQVQDHILSDDQSNPTSLEVSTISSEPSAQQLNLPQKSAQY